MIFRSFFHKRLSTKIKKSECICFTFDDGPNAEATPKVLDLLNKANAKATFFVLGENVEKHPEIVKRIINEGHELAEHSYRHTHPWRCLPLKYTCDLIKGARSIEKFISPNELKLFRPPYGKLNLITLIYIFITKKHFTFWDIDSKDYKQQDEQKIVDVVLGKLQPGSIILFHDNHRTPNNNIQVTVSALKLILESLQKLDLRLTTIKNALEKSTLNS